MPNNIYLIGMMGSGKSIVSKLLAKKVGRERVDLDEEMVREEGASIAEIFEEKGEPYFRSKETEILKTFSRKDGMVIATGGGVVISDENLDLMKETGTMVYLKASTDSLSLHVKSDGSRPLLRGGEPEDRLQDIFESRKHQYEKADFIIEVDQITPDEITENILKLLETERKV